MIKWETDEPIDGVNAMLQHTLTIGGVLCRWWGEKEPEGAKLLEMLANSSLSGTDLLSLPVDFIETQLARLASQSEAARLVSLRCIVEWAASIAISTHCAAQARDEPIVVTVRDQYRMAALARFPHTVGMQPASIASHAVDVGDALFDLRGLNENAG